MRLIYKHSKLDTTNMNRSYYRKNKKKDDSARTKTSARKKLAVWKFASCDGCQLSLLDCEEELLTLASTLNIALFAEATSYKVSGPYHISLVEGSISTREQLAHIQDIRKQSRFLITIGACATAGGIQSLRNFVSIDDFLATVYASPQYISTLATSTPIASHVDVDFELQGCPINKHLLLEVLAAFLSDRTPVVPQHSVCVECKSRGLTCITVAAGVPCLGPITQAGCGAICPAFNRGCYTCYGPKEAANPRSLLSWHERELLVPSPDSKKSLRLFYASAYEHTAAGATKKD